MNGITETKTAAEVIALARRYRPAPTTPVVRLAVTKPVAQKINKTHEVAKISATRASEQSRLQIARWEKLHEAFRLTEKDEFRLKQLEIKSDQVSFTPVPISKIFAAVMKFYGVGKADILSARRTASVVRPRQMFFYLARKHTLHSYPSIGRICGGKDHTTILHGEQKIARQMRESVDVFREASEIESILFGGGEG